jgi:diacylglycerol kinase (ATP)
MTEQSMRCAVVFNPTKVTDAFETRVRERLQAAGWPDPLWLSTTAEDPGRSMTAEAVAAGVDLVIAAGGDGTVRIVADGLAGSGIPMGLVPAGTGNLLARNLGLPLDESKALDVAVEGHTRTIDLIKITVDDGRAEHYAVMAGVGVDAVIMDETDPALKAQIGPAAYFVAAARALGRLPIDMRIKIDDHRPHHRKAQLCTIGNVGTLTGNLTLIPGAKPDDGILNVYVASPHQFTQWLWILVRLVTRRPRSRDHVDQWVGRRVELVLKEPDNYELDGDVLGEARRMVAEIQPGALVVCVPS